MRGQLRQERRTFLEEKHGSAGNKKIIDAEKTSSYMTRLKRPYVKCGVEKRFFDQYEAAPEKELHGHFWIPHSSSRFVFEAYAWLAEEPFCKDIAFEYMLPKIRTGLGRESTRIRPATMDVFLHLEADYYFIESKFCEFYAVKKRFQTLSESYYRESRPGLLLARFHNNEKIARVMPRLIGEIGTYLRKVDEIHDFFDPKQEIAHLVGIALWLNDNPDIQAAIRSGKKKLHFFNAVFRFDEPADPEAEEFRRFFLSAAQNAFWDMFEISLDYDIRYSQDFVEELLLKSDDKLKTKAFGSVLTVIEAMEQFEK